MRRCGKQAQHPYYEKVVRDHGRDFCEADRLDPDSCDELLVGEGGEQLARYGGGVQVELSEDDEEGEGDGQAGCDDEGEEDLGIIVSDMLGSCQYEAGCEAGGLHRCLRRLRRCWWRGALWCRWRSWS